MVVLVAVVMERLPIIAEEPATHLRSALPKEVMVVAGLALDRQVFTDRVAVVVALRVLAQMQQHQTQRVMVVQQQHQA